MVKSAIAEGEAALGIAGRFVIRKSGIEPLVRLKVKAMDGALMDWVVTDVAERLARPVGLSGLDGVKKADNFRGDAVDALIGAEESLAGGWHRTVQRVDVALHRVP